MYDTYLLTYLLKPAGRIYHTLRNDDVIVPSLKNAVFARKPFVGKKGTGSTLDMTFPDTLYISL